MTVIVDVALAVKQLEENPELADKMMKLLMNVREGFVCWEVDYEDKNEFTLDGEYLFSTDHDMHGWSGMQDMRENIKIIAHRLGIPYREDYKESER